MKEMKKKCYLCKLISGRQTDKAEPEGPSDTFTGANVRLLRFPAFFLKRRSASAIVRVHLVVLPTTYYPDRLFHNLKASQSVDRRSWTVHEIRRSRGFWGSKILKWSVGNVLWRCAKLAGDSGFNCDIPLPSDTFECAYKAPCMALLRRREGREEIWNTFGSISTLGRCRLTSHVSSFPLLALGERCHWVLWQYFGLGRSSNGSMKKHPRRLDFIILPICV